MSKQTYEVIATSKVVNLDNEEVKTLNVGETITGEFVLIDENPFVEIPEGYVSTDGLAEQIKQTAPDELEYAEHSVRSKNTKLILALVGAGVGYGVAHFMKKDLKWKIIFTIGGLGLGLGIEYINSRNKK
mgnify:CR=1 FL=1|jgi:hypothetical protein